MRPPEQKTTRVLGIAPSSKGFGFALLEGKMLADWGRRTVGGDKNRGCVTHVKRLLLRDSPDLMALQDYWANDSKRSPRIRALGRELICLANDAQIRVEVLSRSNLFRKILGRNAAHSKYQLALELVKRFPEELGFLLPPPRRAWQSEDARLDIFEAVGLALVMSSDEVSHK